jgi:SAM-dependent methyltransferase
MSMARLREQSGYVAITWIRPRPTNVAQVRGVMQEYYRGRAANYDASYDIPELADDLRHLKAWLVDKTRDRTILEVAAGTGYWTEVAAPVAKAITATDCNSETLAIAKRRKLGSRVTFVKADAYALPEFDRRFNAGMAHLWWSHVDKQSRAQFLAHFTSRLQPGAALLMIDQRYAKAFCRPAWRRDRWGNRFEIRTADDGSGYEILKNYPRPDEVLESVAPFCDETSILKLRYFWALQGRVSPLPSSIPLKSERRSAAPKRSEML